MCPVTHDGEDGESDTLDAVSEDGGSSEGSGRNKGAAARCAGKALQCLRHCNYSLCYQAGWCT